MSLAVNTIVFDFDGTLVDSTALIVEIFTAIKDEFNLNHISSDEIRDFKKKSLMDQLAISGISLTQLPRLVKRIQEEYSRHLDTLNWHEGIEEMLDQLAGKGLKFGILTSNKKENIEQFLRQKNEQRFSFVYSAKKLFSKDKTLVQLMKKQTLGVSELLYVGDELSDIEACKKEGVPIIAVSWGYDQAQLLRQAQPRLVVESVQELLKAILSFLE